jgi:hypothetical protein
VALRSEAHLKPHERFFIPNYHFYQTACFLGRRGGSAVTVRKGIPYNHVDLPPLVSIETTGVSTPIGSSETLLAAVLKSPGQALNDADITELLSFRHKSLLAGGMNAKYQFRNSVISKILGAKLLNLLHINNSEISASQCPTHYSPAGNGGLLDIILHKNVWLSEVIVSDILDSGHLPIMFHSLDHIRTR